MFTYWWWVIISLHPPHQKLLIFSYKKDEKWVFAHIIDERKWEGGDTIPGLIYVDSEMGCAVYRLFEQNWI